MPLNTLIGRFARENYIVEELLSKSSPEASALINKIKKYRQVDNAKHLDMACDLFDLAQECGNEDLKNYASCALGDACCQNGDFSQALYYLSAGVHGLEKTDEYELACICNNELGIIFRSQGHYITSEEYFLNCIEIARANRIYVHEGLACFNFASLCAEMEAPKRALEYHYRTIESCKYITDEMIRDDLLAGARAFIIKLYVKLDEAENAEKEFSELEKLLESHPEFEDLYDVQIAKYLYYRYVKNLEQIEAMRAKVLKSFYQSTDYIIYFDETKELIRVLSEDNDFDELTKVFNFIESNCEADEVVDLRLFMETHKIEMYGKLGDPIRLTESLKFYHHFSEKKAEDNKRSFLTTLRLKSELTQQRTKNLFLTAAAETDPLTGIANRLKLNNVIDELFTLANDQGKSLAVEMMDVDYFKQVNDTYGHSKGDELLVAMGNVLRSIVTDNIFVARYGGDEFIIYYYDMEDDEILDVAKRISVNIKEAASKIGLENLSISQGIVNHVPRPMNRAWDYMNAADLALYYVKNHGKANARLIHRAAEIETLSWDKAL